MADPCPRPARRLAALAFVAGSALVATFAAAADPQRAAQLAAQAQDTARRGDPAKAHDLANEALKLDFACGPARPAPGSRWTS